jgi:predicted Zn-dependent protease
MRGQTLGIPFPRPAVALAMIASFACAGAHAQTKKHAVAAPAGALPAPKTATVPVTTSSPKARQDYELGMTHREELLFTEEGLNYFRESVKADPHFALGHATVAFFSDDPAEGERERALAAQYAPSASPDERLLIRWMNGSKNGQLIPAISAMNDLMARYPKDKRLGNMMAEWLLAVQQAYDRAETILKRVLHVDPEYAPAMNNLAYCYALGGQPNLAPPLMDQYVAALPGQPNPQDSYGEILRMAGDFPDALEHYRTALRIDPAFVSSQVGIASTYALMGDQDRARVEYLKAIAMAKEPSDRLQYRMLWAMTYFRENRVDDARKAYLALAAEAHKGGFPLQEAEIHRYMALFNDAPEKALADLDDAKAVAARRGALPPGQRDAESATILQTRAFVAARAGLGDIVEQAFLALTGLAHSSRDNIVQRAFHSVNGALLFTQGRYADAAAELGEDSGNPLSLTLLADAQDKAGQNDESLKTTAALAAINDERVESAFAVPAARVAMKAANGSATAAAH